MTFLRSCYRKVKPCRATESSLSRGRETLTVQVLYADKDMVLLPLLSTISLMMPIKRARLCLSETHEMEPYDLPDPVGHKVHALIPVVQPPRAPARMPQALISIGIASGIIFNKERRSYTSKFDVLRLSRSVPRRLASCPV